jgi:hypothetical protein
MNAIDIIAQVLKSAADGQPAGQDWNLNSQAACDMLADMVYLRLVNEKIISDIVPPINPPDNK